MEWLLVLCQMSKKQEEQELDQIREKLKRRLEESHARLIEDKVRVSLSKRGNRLYLKATLPPKPGSGKKDWHQQTISLV